MTPHPQQDDIVLKCWTPSFQALRSGDKTFELRKNDRPYTVGKTIRLDEWNPGTEYTGESDRYKITWILWEGFGLPEGYIIMSVVPCKAPTPAPAAPETKFCTNMGKQCAYWNGIECIHNHDEEADCFSWLDEHDATIRNQTLDEAIKESVNVFLDKKLTKVVRVEDLESLRTPSTQDQQHDRGNRR